LGKEEVQGEKLKNQPALNSEEKAEALIDQELVGAFCFLMLQSPPSSSTP
jgi:hypothetical protein